MKRLPVIAALIAFAMLLPLGAARATSYGRDATSPACATMRTNVIGAPYLPEPNRDDMRKAMALAGGDTQPFGNIGVVRRQYAQAFELLQKIDEEGMDRLALLPSDTPRIDLIIDRHVVNLVWARTMLGTFYEQGRAPAVDYARAGAFFQKAVDTNFVDERGCAHTAPVAALVPLHLAGILIYGEGVAKDRAKAKALLQGVGDKAESILYLLDKNALPKTYAEYLNTNFDDLAYAVKNPPPSGWLTWLTGEGMDDDAIIALLGRILLGCAVAVALFVGAVGLFRYMRRKQGYKDETSIYRTLFAVYDVLHNIVARFGLVAEGLIGCFLGLSILFGGMVYGGFGAGINIMVFVSGVTAFLGGIAKLVEAARVSMTPRNTLVHGSARPAAEPEAQAAARGAVKAPDLGKHTFKD